MIPGQRPDRTGQPDRMTVNNKIKTDKPDRNRTETGQNNESNNKYIYTYIYVCPCIWWGGGITLFL